MKIRYTKEENNNVMSRYDHKIETSLEGIEHLSKEDPLPSWLGNERYQLSIDNNKK